MTGYDWKVRQDLEEDGQNYFIGDIDLEVDTNLNICWVGFGSLRAPNWVKDGTIKFGINNLWCEL